MNILQVATGLIGKCVLVSISLVIYYNRVTFTIFIFDKKCRTKLEAFLLRSMEEGLILDGVVAQDINQSSSFWRIREVQYLDAFGIPFFL